MLLVQRGTCEGRDLSVSDDDDRTGQVVDMPLPKPAPEEQPLLNEQGKFLRRPTGAEVTEYLRAFFLELADHGELPQTTYWKIIRKIDATVPLVDSEWWEAPKP